MVPARSHKPNYVGSSPTPATNSPIPTIRLMNHDSLPVVGLSVAISISIGADYEKRRFDTPIGV